MEKSTKTVLKCISNHAKNSLKRNKTIHFKLIFFFLLKLKVGFSDMRCDHKCDLFRLLVRGTTKLTSMADVLLNRYRAITRNNQRETGLSPARVFSVQLYLPPRNTEYEPRTWNPIRIENINRYKI